MIKNFLFDFDGTLADSGDAAVVGVQETFRKAKLKVPTAQSIRYYMGVPIETSFPIWTDHKLDDDQMNELYDSFRKIYGQIELSYTKLFPGMREVLEQLQQSGRKIFLVTSKASMGIKRSLNHLKIADFFTDTIGSDQVAHYKPAPDGVIDIVRKNNLDLDECVMIGDAKYDLQMGNTAGVKTCGCKWGAFDVQSLKDQNPTYLLDKPEQLLEIK